ncbi:MAG: hypothetical protein KDA78_02530 [Planctomycetaceae bacterium]|nr:hypothetical protein [Planctomycetaceae bacterium]
MYRTWVLSVLIWGGAITASAFGQENPALFDALDKNKDGVVKADELDSTQKDDFARLLRVSDLNKDEQIDRQEFANAFKPEPVAPAPFTPQFGFGGNRERGQMMQNPEAVFAMLDRNRDGKVSLSEVPEQARDRMENLFRLAVKQELTQAELTELISRYRPGNRLEMMEGPAPRSAAWQTLDRNEDGKISSIEMELAPLRLKALDRNRDGILTEQELNGE